MSATARWMIAAIGIAWGVAFLLLPMPETAALSHQIARYCIAGFGLVIAISCFPSRLQTVAVRFIAFCVFATCVVYIVEEWGKPMPRVSTYRQSDSNPINAGIAFLIFGLPAGCVMLTGRFPRWTLLGHAFHKEEPPELPFLRELTPGLSVNRGGAYDDLRQLVMLVLPHACERLEAEGCFPPFGAVMHEREGCAIAPTAGDEEACEAPRTAENVEAEIRRRAEAPGVRAVAVCAEDEAASTDGDQPLLVVRCDLEHRTGECARLRFVYARTPGGALEPLDVTAEATAPRLGLATPQCAE